MSLRLAIWWSTSSDTDACLFPGAASSKITSLSQSPKTLCSMSDFHHRSCLVRWGVLLMLNYCTVDFVISWHSLFKVECTGGKSPVFIHCMVLKIELFFLFPSSNTEYTTVSNTKWYYHRNCGWSMALWDCGDDGRAVWSPNPRFTELYIHSSTRTNRQQPKFFSSNLDAHWSGALNYNS